MVSMERRSSRFFLEPGIDWGIRLILGEKRLT
ncbi:hypothetical protein CSUI_010704 [Cystoisospora suis]|uniref:Uncharacterized protein n=1 Tax=Cystoisospora suis TaxID=483139 RepID=A0A2C6KCN1_9APIC|nr:hypothetical protein CSUI_010704 [Cystoisospora suis]